jgi:hypothetical protein
MPSTRIRALLALSVLAILVSLFASHPASAQCDNPSQGFQSVAVEPTNSFQAEYAWTGLLRNFTGLTAGTQPRSVARDSKGRVRVDTFSGKYNTKSPDGQQSEVERHIIWICDRVTQNSIQLDTVDKTATLRAPFPRPARLPPPKPNPLSDLPFCARSFAARRGLRMVRTQDLGHQVVFGFDAVGQREWYLLRDPRNPERTPAESDTPTNYRDWWCSDDLGAMLQRIDVASSPIAGIHRSELNLSNIQRIEPDPSLFEIPPGYTLIERAMEGNHLPHPRPQPAPSSTSNPQ